jgi:membrane-associated phospholipid phosphatase
LGVTLKSLILGLFLSRTNVINTSTPLNSRLATILSVVFHPLILTTYLFAVLFLMTPDLVGVSSLELPEIGSLLLLIFLNTFVAPSLVVYYMYRFGLTTTLQIESLAERRLPYLASILLYGLATYLFGWKLQRIGEMAPQISVFLWSATVALIVVFLVSLYWKISAHATGLGGVLGTLICLLIRFDEPLLLYPVLLTIVICGLVISARLQQNAHTPAQVLAGLFAGVAVSVSIVLPTL